jgi:hypothetical protein
MKAPTCIALIACLFGSCATDRSPANLDPHTARTIIVSALPAGWSLIPHQDETQQRITDAYFIGPGNEAFILVGPQPNYIDWADHEGNLYREFLAKECLYVWIVPGGFKPKFVRLSFFNFFDPPWHPHPVFASRNVRVYGDVQHYIANTNRTKQLLREASYISSPEIHLSWKSWRRDIAASLRK